MKTFAIFLRVIVFMCLSLLACVLLMTYTKVGNPHFYAMIMFPCYSIVGFFAMQGVMSMTNVMVRMSEIKNPEYNPEPYQPTEYERRRALDPNYGKKEQIPEHGN